MCKQNLTPEGIKVYRHFAPAIEAMEPLLPADDWRKLAAVIHDSLKKAGLTGPDYHQKFTVEVKLEFPDVEKSGS